MIWNSEAVRTMLVFQNCHVHEFKSVRLTGEDKIRAVVNLKTFNCQDHLSDVSFGFWAWPVCSRPADPAKLD